METYVGPHTYFIFTIVFFSFAYGVYAFEPDSVTAKCVASILFLAGIYIAQKLIPRGRYKSDGKAVFITGCDHGFGHKLAIRCDEIGLRVFAGCLSSDSKYAKGLASCTSNRLTIVPCDVTSDKAVRKAQTFVQKKVEEENLVLWACINIAGISRCGEIEMLPLKIYLDMFDVNTWGMIRVTKAFIPMIRESKGRFINMTSVLARWCNPTNSGYCMSKHAADTFNDVLRYEMHKWGVKVAIVQPGPYGPTTGIMSSWGDPKQRADFLWNQMDDATKRIYGRAYVDKIEEGIVYHAEHESYRDNTPVMDALEDAILSKHPKHRYVIAGLLAAGCWKEFVRHNFLPTWFSDLKMLRQQSALGVPALLQDKNKHQ